MGPSRGSQGVLWTDDPSGAAELFGLLHLDAPLEGTAPDWWDRLGAPRPGRGYPACEMLPGWRGPSPLGAFIERSTVSQYRVLRESCAGGSATERPIILVAGAGDNFEGQSGRSWRALAGNLHLSLALPCRLEAGPGALALTALPAVAVHRMLAALLPEGAGLEPGIKWPNDILLGDRKAAGVLTWARSRDGMVDAVVYGIGVNVAAVPDLPPSLFSRGATSLTRARGSGPVVPGKVLGRLLAEIVGCHRVLHDDGPAAVVHAYRAASALTGRRVGIWPAETPDGVDPAVHPPQWSGIVEGIAGDLALQLEGQSEPVRSGRLAILA